MARQHSFCQYQLPVFLKSLLLGCLTLLLVIGLHRPGTAQLLPQQAQALLDQGHQQLAQGYPAAAITSWRQAQRLYEQLQDSEGKAGSLINQSLAYQNLGQYPHACKTLAQPLHFEEEICTALLQLPPSGVELKDRLLQSLSQQFSPVQVLGLRNLGDVLRQMNQLETAQAVLERGLTAADALRLDDHGLRLSLAHTHQALYKQAQNDWWGSQQEPQLGVALQEAQTALKLYESVNHAGVSPALATTAQLQQLALLLDLKHWTGAATPFQSPDLIALEQQLPAQIAPLAQNLLKPNLASLGAVETIKAHLILADIFQKIGQAPKLTPLPNSPAQPVVQFALDHAQSAYRSSQQLGNWRLESAAAGLLGDLSRQQQRESVSRQFYKVALSRAQAAEAPDLAYQWQQRLGDLDEQQGNRVAAKAYYQAAVGSLNQVRQSLYASNPDFQFSFWEQVEPIYQHYMSLLLDAPASDRNEVLKDVIETNRQLRLAELENYLRCSQLDVLPIEDISLTESRAGAAFISILDLGNRYEVIVQSPDGTLHRHTPDAEVVRMTAEKLLTDLYDKNATGIPEPVLLPKAQVLYQQLLAPLKRYLPRSGTLVFTLDSSLQQIPMDLLHDGSSYLFEKYGIALTLNAQLRPSKSLPARRLEVLLAGVSETAPSFESPRSPQGLQPLPKVVTEIKAIESLATADQTLLNEAFTRERLHSALKSRQYPIIHISTHGRFSSDPSQTMILAWDQPLDLTQFRAVLQQSDPAAIELLTLSACQTAEGDKRSVLGLAGVAVQAGARSTLASLWLVEQDSTALLMKAFYQNLKAGMEQPEALRQAKLVVRQDPRYTSPFYWSSFILLGGAA